jgi:hypothetical protein
MFKGANAKVTARSGDIITLHDGATYKLGPVRNEHVPDGHADVKVGDILVAELESAPGAATFVYVHEGCGCRFLIYPEAQG